jgi:Flp pilus assembly protein TadG
MRLRLPRNGPIFLRRLRDCRRGVAIIEFAFVLPIITTMLFGILVYGNYFFLAHSIQQLANDAARSSIAGLTDDERTDLATETAMVEAAAASAIDADRLAVDVVDHDDFVTVRVTYDASDSSIFRIGLLPMPDPVISRTAAVRMGGL